MKYLNTLAKFNCRYDWFVRLDDDAYVDIEKLVKLLAKINSSKPLYIGREGLGKNADDYVDTENGENYCMVSCCF